MPAPGRLVVPPQMMAPLQQPPLIGPSSTMYGMQQPFPIGASLMGIAPVAAAARSGRVTPKGSGANTPAHPMQRALSAAAPAQPMRPGALNSGAGSYQPGAPLMVAPPPGVLLPESLSPGSPGPMGPQPARSLNLGALGAGAPQQEQPQAEAWSEEGLIPITRALSAGAQLAAPGLLRPGMRRAGSNGALGSGTLTPLEPLSPPKPVGPGPAAAAGNGYYHPRAGSAGSGFGYAIGGSMGSVPGSLRSSLDLAAAMQRGSGSPPYGPKGGTLAAGSPKVGGPAPGSRAGSAGRRGAAGAAGGVQATGPPIGTEVDEFDNIKVAIRVRPPNSAELARGDAQVSRVLASGVQGPASLLPAWANAKTHTSGNVSSRECRPSTSTLPTSSSCSWCCRGRGAAQRSPAPSPSMPAWAPSPTSRMSCACAASHSCWMQVLGVFQCTAIRTML